MDLTRRLLAGMQGLLTRLESLVFGEANVRTALLLLHYAKIFGEKTPEGTVVGVPLTHREIASWIGTTRETASLQVEALQKEGIIRYRGRTIVITNTDALKKKASYSY
jgi:CRP/FNR family transcriptional regulator